MEKFQHICIDRQKSTQCVFCGQDISEGSSHWAEPCRACLEAVGRNLLLVFPEGDGVQAVSASIDEVERVLGPEDAKRIREKRFGVLPRHRLDSFVCQAV